MLRWQWRCMPHSSLNFKGKCLESVRNSSAEFISHTLKRGPTFKGNSNEAVNPSIWYQNVQFFKFWESAQTEHGSHWGQRSQAQHYLKHPKALLLKKKKKTLKDFFYRIFLKCVWWQITKNILFAFLPFILVPNASVSVSCHVVRHSCSRSSQKITNNSVLTEIWFFSDHWTQDFLLSQQIIRDIIPLITWLQRWATGRAETQNRQPEV